MRSPSISAKPGGRMSTRQKCWGAQSKRRRVFCSRRPAGDVSAVNVALALRIAKRLQKTCFQRQSKTRRRHDEEQMKNKRRESDRREKDEEQHRDISLCELDKERREFLSEPKQAGTLHQIAVARIKGAA